MTTDTKPTNPKDAFGSTKVPMGLAPDTAIAELALAFLEGALKYGRYNWRISGVRASIYNDAIERHRSKWWNGQDRDPKTKVKELASVMACCAILIDAELVGKLDDDRPPMAPMNELLDINMAMVEHLKDLFKDHHPHQNTIYDTPHLQEPANYGSDTPPFDGLDVADTTLYATDTNAPAYNTTVEGLVGNHASLSNHGDPYAALVDRLKPIVGDRIQGTDCFDCEDGVEHIHVYTPPKPVAMTGRLKLECGCTGACKGHPTEEVEPVREVMPVMNALVERYAKPKGPCDPSGKPYKSGGDLQGPEWTAPLE